MSSYVTVEQIKDAIGIKGNAQDTVDDATLSSVVFRASGMVDSYLDRIRPGYVGFAAGSNSRGSVGSNTRIYDGQGNDTLFIDDAMSVSSVVVAFASVSGTNTTTIDPSSYSVAPYNSFPKRYLTFSLPFTSVAGLLPSVWNPGTANIQVTGYWGLNFVPDDVQQVTLALAVLIWQRYQNGNPAPLGLVDDEVRSVLSNLDLAWRVEVVGGAGVSQGGVASGAAQWDFLGYGR